MAPDSAPQKPATAEERRALLLAEREKDERLLADLEAGRVKLEDGASNDPWFNDFVRWFESQPPEWIGAIDAEARKPPRSGR